MEVEGLLYHLSGLGYHQLEGRERFRDIEGGTGIFMIMMRDS